MMLEELQDASILVVDDDDGARRLLQRALNRAGCERVTVTGDPMTVETELATRPPDLLLLDYRLPPIDAFDVLDRIWGDAPTQRSTPVIMLTAGADDTVRRRALERGVSDFLGPPWDMVEVVLRVRNVLRIHQLFRQVQRQNEELDEMVRLRTLELEAARAEILERLAIAAEYRDDDTGEHARRVCGLAQAIAEEMGVDHFHARSIGSAALLHDLGKIGVPDGVLLKPGLLTPEELVVVQRHAEIGGRILNGCTQPLLALAREIALTHHERWDGKGYPMGLRGHAIPLSGRIVAVADAFDAMTNDRPYRKAISPAGALAEIVAQRGSQFDPAVVEAFVAVVRRRRIDSYDASGAGCA